MELKLEDIRLDRDNPRFLHLGKDISEEEIFNYFCESENLNKLIQSIQRRGFITIGERVVVTKENDYYVVLEGNRRICALKAIHHYFKKRYDTPDAVISKTMLIDVDIVESRAEIQSYLAARHIEGIQTWSPEARRNFYYSHYKKNMPINEIVEMTQQRKSEIQKYIDEEVFFQFFKKISNVESVKEPSLIYDRIRRYYINMKIIKDYKSPEIFSKNIVEINKNILDEEEVGILGATIYTGIVKKSLINSRTISTQKKFEEVIVKESFGLINPKSKKIVSKIMNNLEIENFIPLQKKFKSFETRIPRVSEIIDYSIIKDEAVILISDSNGVSLTQEEFRNSSTGNYQIKVNDFEYDFTVIPLIFPSIQIDQNLVNDIEISKVIELNNLVKIFDCFDERVLITDSQVKFTPGSGVSIQQGKMFVSDYSKEVYFFEVEFKSNINTDFIISERVVFNPKPQKYKPRQKYSQIYFSFKIFDGTQMSKNFVIERLLSELEDNFREKKLHVFASALRSLLEIIIYEFSQGAPTGVEWHNPKMDIIVDKFKNMDAEEIDRILNAFTKKSKQETAHQMFQYKTARNYFKKNITEESIEIVYSSLNLGAHKSMYYLSDIDLMGIRDILVAWIELIYIIQYIDYKY